MVSYDLVIEQLKVTCTSMSKSWTLADLLNTSENHNEGMKLCRDQVIRSHALQMNYGGVHQPNIAMIVTIVANNW